MRKLFFLILLMFALPALLFSTLENGGGYVLIAVANRTIEMSFLVALILNILAFVSMYLLLVLVRSLLSTRRGVLGWAKNQRRQRGLNRTTQGLIAFVEGRWDYARKSLDKSADNSSTPLVNYLFAARASSAIGDAKAVDGYLKQAELSTEGADVAIGLTQAELQMHNGQYEQALATLLRAKKQANHHPVVLSLLAKVYFQLNDWDSLLKLIPTMRKFDALPDTNLDTLEREACCAKLLRASTELGDGGGSDNDNETAVEQLQNCWKHLPGNMKKNIAVIACYCEHLIAGDASDEAERLLRNQMHKQYDSQLVRLYGLAVGDNLDKQLSFAKKLLKSNAEDPEALLAVARIARKQQLSGEAKTHLLQCIELAGTLHASSASAAYIELASIFAEQGDYQQSSECYAKAVQESGAAKDIITLPDAARAKLADNGNTADAGPFASTDSIPSFNVR